MPNVFATCPVGKQLYGIRGTLVDSGVRKIFVSEF
jgi:hypothetical protein